MIDSTGHTWNVPFFYGVPCNHLKRHCAFIATQSSLYTIGMLISVSSIKSRVSGMAIITSVSVASLVGGISIYNEMNGSKQSVSEISESLHSDFDQIAKFEVQAAMSVIQSVYARQESGELRPEQAKLLAADLIRKMKYGVEGYFWIDTFDGVNVAYLGRDTEGKSRFQSKDANGKYFIQEIIANAQKEDGGFTNYAFPKRGSDTPLPKRSYSLAFKPYSWVLGTGNYIDDIDARVHAKEIGLQGMLHHQIIALLIWTAVAVLIALAFAYWLGNKISKQIHSVSDMLFSGAAELRASVGQVLSISHDMANISVKQSTSSQETAAAAQEISATTQKSAESAKESEDLSTHSKLKATEGRQIVENMARSMVKIDQSNDAVSSAVNDSNSKIADIVKVIDEINGKTKVINDIVFQTKLLSFNASVEAARAGEHGKGFAVVAEEVGNLAQMSGNASQEISQLLEKSTNQVHQIINSNRATVDKIMISARSSVTEGTQVVNECERVLKDIVDSSDSVFAAVSSISVASSEQSIAVAEIAKAIQEIDHTTQIGVQTAQSCSAAAAQLAGKTKSLTTLSSRLRSIVEGRKVIAKMSWIKEYSLDIDAMDNEHILLIEKMNILSDRLETDLTKTDRSALVAAFDDLLSYTKKHFSDEEKFMESFGYAELVTHRKIHLDLLNKVGTFAQSVENGTVDAEALMDFLNDWLVNHIMNNDRKYASYFKINGARLQRAARSR